ncbi:MAG: 2-C-methyl-D-erythritol 4-phosphate cytidylyltransferase [Phycisphaerales bacterium]|nr:MAG: 2-C-methyl-D-erythritol 4-phosphate cytidylyltransferase [Phycisphaerales bacterium]
MRRIAVIIPAAGKGERFGRREKKIFAKLDGRPIFLRTLELFVNRDDVCQTILVVSRADLEEVKTRYGANLGFMGVRICEGGEARYDSVRAALEIVNDDAELVAIHDAVRPCATDAVIDAVFAEAAKTGAAILASPLQGTIKRVSDSGTIDATVPRERLYEAQTPQVFKRQVIAEAYANPPESMEGVTDDACLVERTGHPVSIVESNFTNLKITTRADITLANAILKARPAAKPQKKLGAFEEAQW